MTVNHHLLIAVVTVLFTTTTRFLKGSDELREASQPFSFIQPFSLILLISSSLRCSYLTWLPPHLLSSHNTVPTTPRAFAPEACRVTNLSPSWSPSLTTPSRTAAGAPHYPLTPHSLSFQHLNETVSFVCCHVCLFPTSEHKFPEDRHFVHVLF